MCFARVYSLCNCWMRCSRKWRREGSDSREEIRPSSSSEEISVGCVSRTRAT